MLLQHHTDCELHCSWSFVGVSEVQCLCLWVLWWVCLLATNVLFEVNLLSPMDCITPYELYFTKWCNSKSIFSLYPTLGTRGKNILYDARLLQKQFYVKVRNALTDWCKIICKQRKEITELRLTHKKTYYKSCNGRLTPSILEKRQAPVLSTLKLGIFALASMSNRMR